MAYAFFFSYATADTSNDGGAMEWFFQTLNEELKRVHGAKRVDEGGFRAPTSIEAAEHWSRDALPRALNHSRVLVALESPNYFDSDYCGRELEVFLRRRQRFVEERDDRAPACIIQVLWQSVYDTPATRPEFQWKRLDGSRFPAEADGLYKAYIGGRETELRLFVHSLAERISILLRRNVGSNELPPLPRDPDIHGVPSTFAPPVLPLPEIDFVQKSGPTAATFVYPNTLSNQLSPFGPPLDRAAVSRAAAIARSREMSVQGIEFKADDERLAARIAAAQSLNSPVVLMLTSASLAYPVVRKACETIRPEGIATVLVDGTTNDGDRVHAPFIGSLRAKNLFHADLAGPDDLDAAVKRSLGTLYNGLAHVGSLTIGRATAHMTLPHA
jgi:hypothetical protein